MNSLKNLTPAAASPSAQDAITASIPPSTTFTDLARRREAAQSKHDAELARMAKEQEVIGERQSPLNHLMQDRENQAQLIGRVKTGRTVYQDRMAELRQKTDSELRKEAHGVTTLNLLYEAYPMLAHAERGLGECDRFLITAEAKLVQLDSEIATMAKERSLTHLLPSHLQHLAQ